MILNQYLSTQSDRVYHIWERRAKWITIQNYPIFMQKLEYIHHNPTQAHWQLVHSFLDYEWSSAKFYETGKDRFEMITRL